MSPPLLQFLHRHARAVRACRVGSSGMAAKLGMRSNAVLAAENGPSSRSRGCRTSQAFPIAYTASISIAPPCPPPMHSCSDAPPEAESFHRIGQMQNNAVAACADRMAEPDAAAVNIQLVARNRTRGPIRRSTSRQNLSSSQAATQASTCAANASFISHSSMSPSDDAMAAQDRGGAQHRPQPHDRRIQRGPLAIDDHCASAVSPCCLQRVFRSEDHPRGAVGDLRAVARASPCPRAVRMPA